MKISISNCLNFFLLVCLASNCYCQNDFIHPDCKLPMHQRIETGRSECQQSFSSYSFNAETRVCEDKVAKGCPNNLNSFNNYYTCMTYCLRPSVQTENCEKPLNISTRCGNFEHNYFRYYFDGRSCEQYTGNCMFNGNHYHNKAHCESTCGEFMDSTKKAHLPFFNPKRKSWCFEKITFQVEDKCISREIQDESSQTNIVQNRKSKYQFDYRANKCRLLETDRCTFNGNSFSTVEECIVDCLPKSFDCRNCDQNKFKKLKAMCSLSQMNIISCNIKYNTFNISVLRNEVEKLRSNSKNLNLNQFYIILFLFLNLKLFMKNSKLFL